MTIHVCRSPAGCKLKLFFLPAIVPRVGSVLQRVRGAILGCVDDDTVASLCGVALAASASDAASGGRAASSSRRSEAQRLIEQARRERQEGQVLSMLHGAIQSVLEATASSNGAPAVSAAAHATPTDA